MCVTSVRRALVPEVLCGEKAADCVCGEAPGHEPPHVCADTVRCNAAWVGEWNADTFGVRRFPIAAEPLLGALYEMLFPGELDE